ncbi:MAG: DUF2974 domain-containing protein [Solobacterium sp.]|nr:DUF2974 domain-containing protein [Solobacterium sp.]
MYTVMDYLDWRGDLDFSSSPFNEVDALILSELAYVEMDTVFHNGMSVEELCHAYEEAGIDQGDFMFDPYPLLQKASQTVRFGRLKLHNYVNRIRSREEIQFSAATFTDKAKRRFIAFRGTDSTLTGWREDLYLALDSAVASQKAAVQYAEKNAGKAKEIVLCGHSKGGNLAVYAAAYCSDELYERISAVYSLDGPGFPDNVPVDAEKRGIGLKTAHFIPEASLVGILMNGIGERIIIRSSSVSFLQHNPYSWSVQYTCFERGEKQTAFAAYVETVLDHWLEELPIEQRKKFIDTVFDALEATGAQSVQDIQQSPVKTFFSFMDELRRSDPELQQNISAVLKELSSTGLDELKEAFDSRIRRQ